MSSAVYLITSRKFPERQYVGSSCLVTRRFSQHTKALALANHCNSKLQNHVNKYGLTDLIFSVLEHCDVRDLISREQYFIDKLRPYFNINPVAESRLGSRHSVVSRLKMSKSAKINSRRRLRDIYTSRFS